MYLNKEQCTLWLIREKMLHIHKNKKIHIWAQDFPRLYMQPNRLSAHGKNEIAIRLVINECNPFYQTILVNIHLYIMFLLSHAWKVQQCHPHVLHLSLSFSRFPQSKYLVCQRGYVSRCSCLSLCFNRLTPGFPCQCQSNSPALIRAALRCVTDCSVSP